MNLNRFLFVIFILVVSIQFTSCNCYEVEENRCHPDDFIDINLGVLTGTSQEAFSQAEIDGIMRCRLNENGDTLSVGKVMYWRGGGVISDSTHRILSPIAIVNYPKSEVLSPGHRIVYWQPTTGHRFEITSMRVIWKQVTECCSVCGLKCGGEKTFWVLDEYEVNINGSMYGYYSNPIPDWHK